MSFYQPERIEAIKQIRIDQRVSLHEAVKIYDEQQRLQLTTPRANLTTGQKEEARMKSTSRIVKEALRESRFPLMAGVSSGMVDIVKRAMHEVAHEVQAQEAARLEAHYADLKRKLAAVETYARRTVAEIESSKITPMPLVDAGRKRVAQSVIDVLGDTR